MTVKRKSPETTNPNKKQKRISTDEKIEIAISKLEEYEKAVKDTLKMLRDIKRESLRPPPINIPEVTATFSSSDDSLSVTPKYSGVSPQYENFITAPRQMYLKRDGEVISKRVFADGREIVELVNPCVNAIGSPRSPFNSDIHVDPAEFIDLTCDTPQAHSPCLPNFVGSPRMCIDDCCCISDIEDEDFEDSEYSGLEGKQKAFYDWRVVPLQALVRGWLVRKNKKQAPTPCIRYEGKMRAYYGCQAIKMQAVVRGGLVRMRRWREKKKETVKILMKGVIPFQALARRFLVRMRVWNVRSTNPEFASTMKSVVRGWLLGEPKKCVKHDLKPVRSGYDHTTYECRKCDYESGCV